MPARRGDAYVAVRLDVPDAERLGTRKLSIGSHGYAQLFDGKMQTLHRWLFGLTGAGYSVLVDHINRDGLDNRRSNLRVVTPSESNLNRSPSDNPFVGVYPQRGRFYASVKRNRKTVHLGTYDTREDARDARNEYLDKCL